MFGRRRDCRGRALWIRPYPVTERDEIGAGLRQRPDLVQACGIADAGHFEQLRPPLRRSCTSSNGKRRPRRSGSPNIT